MPETVQAVRWTGENVDEVMAFDPAATHIESADQIQIPSFECGWTAWPGDWIVRRANGEFMAVKDDVFGDEYTVIE